MFLRVAGGAAARSATPADRCTSSTLTLFRNCAGLAHMAR
jgi:hypothetical protein